jgi:CRP/FNR family nitrogen fixation transcriptional regulator
MHIHTSFQTSSMVSYGKPSARPKPMTVYETDQPIYGHGERSGTVFRVMYGAVRVFRLLSDGRRQVVAFHVAGETFGFEAGATRSFFAEATVPTGLEPVESKLDEQLVMLALTEMVRAQEHLSVVGKQNALEKLAVFLLDLSERKGEPTVMELPMTRMDIGDYLGMTIETVSRSISKFRDMGILKLHCAKKIQILKVDTLRMLAG